MNGKNLKMFDYWLDVSIISETKKLNINNVLLTIRRDNNYSLSVDFQMVE